MNLNPTASIICDFVAVHVVSHKAIGRCLVSIARLEVVWLRAKPVLIPRRLCGVAEAVDLACIPDTG